MKVIKSLENRGILLKETTKKIVNQEGGFLDFLRPLMTVGLPLMKSALTALAKSELLPFELLAAMSATDYSKNTYGSGRSLDLVLHTTALIISNQE